VGSGDPDHLEGTSGRDVIVGLGIATPHLGDSDDLLCEGEVDDLVYGDEGIAILYRMVLR
jgi:hypothetical protein